MSDVNTVSNIATAAEDLGVDASPNAISFTMGFLAATQNGSGKKKENQYANCEDGWWTKWNGEDVKLTLDQKVELAASIAEEVTKDRVRNQ